MPEGDSAFKAAHRVDAALAGKEVTRFDIRVPNSAAADLRGETVRGMVSRGKHLLTRVGDWTLHSHLKMEGRWRVYRPGQKWTKPEYKARAIIGVEDREAVGFELAMVEVLPTAQEDRIVGHLGPDPLSREWDPAEAARRLGADPRPAHVALLDQRNVAGWGNEYVNEMLFVRGVLPTRPATEIDAAAMVDLGARMIRANVQRYDRTFTGDDRPGMKTWVYGREGRPCRRCGTTIRAGTLGANATAERNVFWCPVCQT